MTGTETDWPHGSSATGPRGDSYHGQPVIKAPVWTWEIPAYFFTGGLAGASAGLAWLADVRGNEELGRRAWAAAMTGIATSPLLLISDLGRPMRFLNMLRMFKITSPMSVGSWILSGSGASTTLAATYAWTGLFPRLGRVAKPAAAVFGLPLSTYTGALIANTAVPVWHEAHRELPFVFAAGAALSAAGAAVAGTPTRAAGPARRLAVAAAVAEVGSVEVMEKIIGEHAGPYREGTPRRFKRVSQASIATSTALLAWRGASSRAVAVLAGGLLLGGALATRWSIFKAGTASALDPKYVVGPQRRGIESGARTGAARREPQVAAASRNGGSPATARP